MSTTSGANANGVSATVARTARAATRFVVQYAAPITLAVFLIVGLAVLDDYGVSTDEGVQRNIGFASLNYVLGDEDALYDDFHRYYGVAFEVFLAAAERVLGLEDSREIYLSRHLLTHLFFLAGGFFAWLLTYRMFGSRLLALFAMLIFLLHPRLYANSFVNTKDIPFIVAFMAALYLIHRAFRRDTVWAFALCGVGVGLLMNVRNIGVMLFAAVLGMMALDAVLWALRRSWDGRAALRGLAKGGAFALAAALTLYATFPTLWNDPLALADGLRTFSQHPTVVPTLFQGEYVRGPNAPAHYIPTWALITTPPIALALAAVGAGRVVYSAAAQWRTALANGEVRFWILLIACVVLPPIGAVVADSNIYNGWRQMYFIYAPICLLAALGLRQLAAALDSKPRARFALCALAALGIAAVVVQMVRLHPYQTDYFNLLVNRNDNLGETYEMDYWQLGRREALEWLLETYPERHMIVRTDVASRWDLDRNLYIIPPEDRRRISVRTELSHFHVTDNADNPAWSRKVYGVPIVSVVDTRARTEAAYRDAYARAAASAPIARGGFDVYLDGDSLTYVKEPCAAEDARGRFLLSVFPIDADDLPEGSRDLGHQSLNFDFRMQGAIFDGRCAIMVDLPSYPMAKIELGQWLPGGEDLWRATAFLDDSILSEYGRAYAAAIAREPVAESGFDVYLDGKTLIYVKEPCAAEDTRGRFLLSVFPVSPDDLPEDAKREGREHVSLNFDFDAFGAIFDGKCVIARTLPDYPIAAIETGQWIPGGERLWMAKWSLSDERRE